MPSTPPIEESDGRLTPAKRGFEVMHNNLVWLDDGIQQQEDFFDGSESIKMPYSNYPYHQVYKTSQDYEGDGQGDDSDIEYSDMRVGNTKPNGHHMSRIERKAMDKELPVHEIVARGGDYLKAFVEAARQEEASCKTWNSVTPLSDLEAKKVMDSPTPRKRIIPSRSAYRDKNKGVGDLRAKARVVIIGCLDPDLFTLNRQCSTPSRQAEYTLLAFYAAGANRVLLNTQDRWLLWSGDVKTAFLQGKPEKRDMPIFMKPPPDQISKLANAFPSKLYLVEGNVYGIASAPRTWALEVIRRLLQAGYRQHSLDEMFCFYGAPDGEEQPRLLSLCLVYVDDFLLVHSEKYDRAHLTCLFTWGSQTECTVDNPIEFKGKTISLRYDSACNEYQVSFTQKTFIDAIEGGNVKRGNKGQQIDPKDISEVRSVTGTLQWVAGQTRPDVAATVSLASRGGKSTYEDLANLYEAVAHLKRTSSEGIVFPKVPINEATCIAVYSDSSWANAEDYTSQHGALVWLTNQNVTHVPSPGILIDWKSGRSGRVCRSTLAADMSVDRATFINFMISEIIQNCRYFEIDKALHMIHITDCKSLYDCICSSSPNTTEKRTIVDIKSLQQFVNRETEHWVPTQYMYADCLTKISKQLMTTFQSWLKNPTLVLRETSHKPKKKLGV